MIKLSSLPGLAVIACLALSVGCTQRKPEEPKAKDPIISGHMRQLESAGISMAEGIDQGHMPIVNSSAATMIDQLERVRGLAPPKRDDNRAIDFNAYNQLLDKTLQDLADIRLALGANRWDIISNRYDLVRSACVRCHASTLEREIPMRLPAVQNF